MYQVGERAGGGVKVSEQGKLLRNEADMCQGKLSFRT